MANDPAAAEKRGKHFGLVEKSSALCKPKGAGEETVTTWLQTRRRASEHSPTPTMSTAIARGVIAACCTRGLASGSRNVLPPCCAAARPFALSSRRQSAARLSRQAQPAVGASRRSFAARAQQSSAPVIDVEGHAIDNRIPGEGPSLRLSRGPTHSSASGCCTFLRDVSPVEAHVLW